MTVVQILTVNLLTDGLPAVALSYDPASRTTMTRRPRGHQGLFPRRLQLGLVLIGLVVGLAATVAYVVGRRIDPEAAQTMAFATLAIAELLLVFSIRSSTLPAWRGPWSPVLVASVGVSLALVVLTIAVPALRELFATHALSTAAIVVVVALAVVPAAAAEAAKVLVRRRG
jgi:Ca2+-transporting ATPase